MKKLKFILSILIVGVILSCGVSNKYSHKPEIEYRVSGTANSVSITLSNANDGTEQFSNVSLPYSYKMSKSGFCYISAQNNSSTGSVKTSIYINGKLEKTSESSGAFVIASSSCIAR